MGKRISVVTAIGTDVITEASQLPITDAGEHYDSSTVEGALQEVGAQLSAKVTSTRQLKYWNRHAAYKIKVAAGRFNMSWNNANGRMWIFPAGTVLYSDGTTPIRTSTAEKPDVTIPAGGGYVWLVSAMWNGLYSLLGNDTNTVLIGSLADLPPLTYSLSLANCSKVTGSLADLPPLTYYLNLFSCSNVTGSLADLPPLTHRLDLFNCSKVTGSLADLPPLTHRLDLFNCSKVTGSYSAVNGNDVPTTTTLTNTGLSAADMDATLIAYAACTKDNGTFTATGKTRTAASDAAVATLTGRGWTISGITTV